MIMTGADILVNVLCEQGCDVVFGYPGGQILNVYDSLYKYSDKITHILSSHEQGAAHAADGYARVSGKTGVVIATSGPGATNLVTGIATAYMDSIPMVAITGNVPTSQIGTDSFQEIDITGVTRPVTKKNFFVDSVDKLADTLREAFRIASSGRKGPVLVDVPKDVQISKCEYTPCGAVKEDEKLAADEEAIIKAAECINNSERPFIYFGGGMISSAAQKEMLELADMTDAPIGCSLMGISGIPTDTPRFLGMQGMHGHYASSMAMHRADCVIALGVRFNDRVTGNRAKFAPHAKIIHIDVDPNELSKTVNAAHELYGDVKLTLQKLLGMIKTTHREEWNKEIDGYREYEHEYTDSRQGLTPRNIILELNKRLSGKNPVVTDVGQHQMWTAQYAKFSMSRRFVSSGGLGTMGFGCGAAIGSAFGSGERTILVTGDGSFGMTLNELATAVTYNVPLVILIMNNGVLGMVRQWQTLFFDKHYSNTVLDRKSDFTAIAKAFGADGERAESLDALGAALDRGFSHNGPYVIDCAVDKDEFVLPMLPPGGSMDDVIVKL